MRKVLSFVLVLAMILGSVSMAFAATPSDVAGKDCEEAVSVLMDFGVVTGYNDGSFKPAGIVTRAEMAAFIIRALGLNPNAASTTQFSDVPSAHWASKYVVYAASLGIIKGRTATMFDPDATVSYDEAVTMLVRALGYTDESLNGTYPAAYVSKAKSLDIIGDIQAGTAGANRGDIAQLVFKTLNCAIGKVDAEGRWIADPNNDTMMARLGAVDYNGGEPFVVIGNEDSIIPLMEYQGAYVTAYQNSDDEIIAIKEVKSVFITDDYVGNNLTTGTLSAITPGATVGDYEVKAGVTFATDAAAFANGTVATTVVSGDSITMACKLSGNYITAIYSVAEWTVSNSRMMAESDLDDLADNELFGDDIILDDNDKVDYTKFALYGVASLDEIEEDDVVYTYESNGEIKRIDVGQEVVTGTVGKINSANDKVTIGTTAYEASAIAPKGDFAALDAGDDVELYLDYAGDVYDYEITSAEADKLAIVLDSNVKANPALGEADSVYKLFLADGTVLTAYVDDDDLKNASAPALTEGSVVYYGLNADGKLNALEIAEPSGLTRVASENITAKGSFDGKYIASDAIIFTATTLGGTTSPAVATTSALDDELAITTLDKVLDTEGVEAVYFYDPDTNKIEWMVMKGGTSKDSVFGAFNMYEKVDSDAGFELTFMVAGEAKTYEATSIGKAQSVTNTGMELYELVFTAEGYFSEGHNLSTAGVLRDGTTVNMATITPGGVLSIKNSVVTVTGDAYTLDSDIIIYKWDTDESEWVKGSTSSIKDTDFENVALYDIDDDMIFDYALAR